MTPSPKKLFTKHSLLTFPYLQRDPLSPCLFIFAQQILFSLITTFGAQKLITPFNLKRVHLSYLVFVDNLLLAFCVNSQSCVDILKALDIFQNLPSPKVTLHKDNIYFSKHVSLASKYSTCNSLGIRARRWLKKYLGSFLSLGHLPQRYQNIPMDKTLSCVQGWYKGLISQARWMVLNFLLPL